MRFRVKPGMTSQGGVVYLGNVRVVADEQGTDRQVTHYYPFGSAFMDGKSPGLQPYKYNGKEQDKMHGLNLYDYHARHYDSAIDRFTTIDPHAENYYSWSPYVYVMNNPMRYIDPDGKRIVDANGKLITYSSKTGWSDNATVDVIKIGNAMMLTPVGKEMLNKLFNAAFNIKLTLNTTPNGDRLGLADMVINKSTGEVKSAELVIYEEVVKVSVNKNYINSEKMKQVGAYAIGATKKDLLLMKTIPSVTERIGQVAVHEAEHITNPKAQSHISGKTKAEFLATEKEIKAINQTVEFNRKLPVPKIKLKLDYE